MRKITIFAACLLFALMSQAQSWDLQPWQKYLISESVKVDTIKQGNSLLSVKLNSPQPYDTRLFRCTTSATFDKALPKFKKLKKTNFGDGNSESMFEEQDRQREMERIAREGYTKSDLICDILSDIVNIFLLKSK